MSTGDPDLRHPRTLCGNAETLLSVRGLMPSCRNELHLEDSELVSPVAMRGCCGTMANLSATPADVTISDFPPPLCNSRVSMQHHR